MPARRRPAPAAPTVKSGDDKPLAPFEPALAALVAEMRRKLALPQVRAKSDLVIDHTQLFELMLDESAELCDALEQLELLPVGQPHPDRDEVVAAVLTEAADICNFAMLIVAAAMRTGLPARASATVGTDRTVPAPGQGPEGRGDQR